MEIILIWIAGLAIAGLSTASYVHRSRQWAFLTKPLKVDTNLRNRVARAFGVDGAVVTSVSMFDVLYNTMKMDPQALRGMEHLHHAQGFESLGDLMDFMKINIIKSEPGEDAWRQMIHKYKGYTGEEKVADNLREWGFDVEIPESGTAEGLDLIVNGKPYNIKVTDNPRYIQEHLDKYPDIDVITNREMAAAFRNNPRVLIDSDLSVQEAFHSTADTFEGIADLGDGIDIPFISLACNVVKNSQKLHKGDLDLKTAAEHTVLDTATTGVGGLVGSKIGLGLGLALAPVTGGLSTVLMPILGSLAGVFTGKGISGWFKERHLRRAIEQIQNLATEFQAAFLDLYWNVVNAMRESFEPSLKMCRRRVVEEGFFRRTVFPSVKTTFYRMASGELKTERGDMRSFYTDLYHAVQDTEEPIEGGMILFANCQEQGVGILHTTRQKIKTCAKSEKELDLSYPQKPSPLLGKHRSMSDQVMQLYPILQAHFPWHKARVTFLSAFLLALMKVTTVNLTKLANALNGKVKPKSNYRRIQRFFAEFTLPEDWATGLILHLLPVKSDFILAMDRTQWSLGKVSINLLTVGILYRDMAFPICFKMLHKKGNSSTQERIDLMKRVRQHIKTCKIRALVADREFIGRKWFKWLTENNMPFVIRLKENAILETGQKAIPLKKRFANLTLNQQTTLPKPGRVYGQSLSLSAIRCPEEWVMVGSNTQGIDALKTYKKRWSIEVLFANLKRRGFDLEQTHLTDADRIEKLIALLTLAVCWAHLMGEARAHHTPLKIKNHEKKEKSLFRYGLDYLQYVLLNIQDHARTFQRCLKILKEARFLPDS